MRPKRLRLEETKSEDFKWNLVPLEIFAFPVTAMLGDYPITEVKEKRTKNRKGCTAYVN